MVPFATQTSFAVFRNSSHCRHRLTCNTPSLHWTMIKHLPHRACLYVDDLLLLLSKEHLQDSACLVIAFLSILGVPISWRKAQLGANVAWCGWTFQFDHETVHLTTEKLAKLRQQLLKLQQSKKILRKKLESSLGLLMWSTTTCRHL